MKEYLYNLATDKNNGPIATILKPILFLLSLVYALAIRILIFFLRFFQYRLNCKVISVGNITLGGTGKTVLVEYIAKYLKQNGHRPAILTRGYKRKNTNYQLPITNYQNMGDEAYMLKMKLTDIPVIVGSDRVSSAKQAIRDYRADGVIMDDGFQQWRIKKDLEIVTIDSTDPFGNRQVIPRGTLREGLSALARADIFVLTKTDLYPRAPCIKAVLGKINPSGLIVESVHKPSGFYNINKADELFGVDILKGKTVALFSGIGDPDSFQHLVTNLGIKVGLSFKFGDHHNYTQADLDNIIKASEEKSINTIVTTEKDAARLIGLKLAISRLSILVLRIELSIKDEQRFNDRLLKLYTL